MQVRAVHESRCAGHCVARLCSCFGFLHCAELDLSDSVVRSTMRIAPHIARTLAIALPCALAHADAPFVLTTFTHMESNYQYPNITVFNNHATKLRFAMTLFEEFGARMTIETEKSFAISRSTYSTNVLMEAITRGHGVGTHCDFGMNSAPVSPAVYSKLFVANKDLVDALVGATNNRTAQAA